MNISKMALASLAALIACAVTAAGLTGEEAVEEAVKFEEMLSALPDQIKSLESFEPTETTETIDGIEYTIATYTDPESGKTLKKVYDPDGKLFRSEFSDPQANLALATVYDQEGNPISETMMTTDEEGNPLRSTEITHNPDGTTTYTTVDYTESEDNKVTTTVAAGGDITDPQDIIEMTVETQPGLPRPPDEHTCPNTGQSEIVF